MSMMMSFFLTLFNIMDKEAFIIDLEFILSERGDARGGEGD